MAATVMCLPACSDPDDGLSVTSDAAVSLHDDAGLDGSTPGSSIDSGLRADASAGDGGVEQAVTLRFKAVVGDQELVCGQTYANQGSSKVSITPQDFRLFVQEVRLISASGSEVPLKFAERLPFQSQGVALLDFTDGSGACSSGDPSTNMIITGTVPAGDYTGVVFLNGVSETLNHANPTTAPAPLMAPGASWGWTLGYRFLMAEVRTVRDHAAGFDGGTQTAADGGLLAPPVGLGFVHVGSTGCSGTEATGIVCANPNRGEVRLTGFNPASSTIVADLGAVFSTADLSADVQCHGAGPACAPMFGALGVDLATGASLPTQRVYRVE